MEYRDASPQRPQSRQVLYLLVGIAALVVVAAAVLVVARRRQKHAFSADIRAVQDKVPLGGPAFVELSITNHLHRPVWLLHHWGPFTPREVPIFQVLYDGNNVPFICGEEGVPVLPFPDSFFSVRLGPGETRTGLIDVARRYDLSQPGDYTIRYFSVPSYRTLPPSTPGGDERHAYVEAKDILITVLPEGD